MSDKMVKQLAELAGVPEDAARWALQERAGDLAPDARNTNGIRPDTNGRARQVARIAGVSLAEAQAFLAGLDAAARGAPRGGRLPRPKSANAGGVMALQEDGPNGNRGRILRNRG
jgi:hypothetical protein